MEDPVQFVEPFDKWLHWIIDEQGDYLFMGFAFLCLVAIAWLLCRKRKPLPPPDAGSAKTRAVIGIMLASPTRRSPEADGGRTDLIMGDGSAPLQNDPDRGRL